MTMGSVYYRVIYNHDKYQYELLKITIINEDERKEETINFNIWQQKILKHFGMRAIVCYEQTIGLEGFFACVDFDTTRFRIHCVDLQDIIDVASNHAWEFRFVKPVNGNFPVDFKHDFIFKR